MASDIKQLLRETSDEPTRPVHASRLVRRARRQVVLARVGTAVGSLVAVLAAVVLLPSVGDDGGSPIVMDRPEQTTGETASETDQRADALWGRTYESVEVASQGTDLRLAEGTRIRLTLTRGVPVQEVEGALGLDEDADGFATWDAGCNRRRQQIQVVGDKLEFGGYGDVTARLCSEELLEQDRWIEDFFDAGPRWRLDDGLLELSTNDGTLALEAAADTDDRYDAQPADELWGRTYESVEVASQSTDLQLVEGTRIRLTLTRGAPLREVDGDLELDEEADGFAVWSAGCNEGRWQVRATDSNLEFGGSGYFTYMLCPTELNEQDRWVNEFFEAEPSWELTDGVLELSTNDLVVVLEPVADTDNPAAG